MNERRDDHAFEMEMWDMDCLGATVELIVKVVVITRTDLKIGDPMGTAAR